MQFDQGMDTVEKRKKEKQSLICDDTQTNPEVQLRSGLRIIIE